MSYEFTTRQKIYLPFKRLFDIVISLLSILILSPLFFVISICVLIDTGGFPIFRQKRIGRNNNEFLILKFRSMNVKTPKDVPTHLLENPDQYLSNFGRWIRKYSIDELPQLFNIFIGQMSLIGPRPALWNQLDLIEGRTSNNVHLIRPGLSGLAQCSGRDELSVNKKVEIDIEYLHKFNIWFDIKIIFISIAKALTHKNVIEGKQS